MRISHIDSAFDQWIQTAKHQLQYLRRSLHLKATEGSRTQKKYIGEEWSLPKQTVSRHMQNAGGTRLADISPTANKANANAYCR